LHQSVDRSKGNNNNNNSNSNQDEEQTGNPPGSLEPLKAR